MKPYPNEELARMSKREIIRLYKRTVEQFNDAVPVIRCKDCKWYYRGGATCMFWDGANGMCEDDFCGKAEREEE